VPLDDESLDVVVFSLSLMGSNHKDYFKEAHRVLKNHGNVFICEPAKKWDGRIDLLKQELEGAGFKGIEVFENTDKFFYVDCIKY
jgi:ubiquinone/menaquinone biosynthesis C-methylase UbiE